MDYQLNRANLDLLVGYRANLLHVTQFLWVLTQLNLRRAKKVRNPRGKVILLEEKEKLILSIYRKEKRGVGL